MNANCPSPVSGTDNATKRTARLIRFFDPESNRIATFAGYRGLTATEFVRFATLAAIEDGDGGGAERLAPLIKAKFRTDLGGVSCPRPYSTIVTVLLWLSMMMSPRSVPT